MNRHRINFPLHQWSIRFRVHRQFFQLVERLEAIDDASEKCVLEVESGLGRVGDEELTLIGIDARVGHRDETSFGVLEVFLELILEFLAPYRLAAFAGVCWIAGLNHEAFNVPNEDAAVEIIRSTKGEKIFSCFGGFLAKHLDLEVTDVGVKRDRLQRRK